MIYHHVWLYCMLATLYKSLNVDDVKWSTLSPLAYAIVCSAVTDTVQSHKYRYAVYIIKN